MLFQHILIQDRQQIRRRSKWWAPDVWQGSREAGKRVQQRYTGLYHHPAAYPAGVFLFTTPGHRMHQGSQKVLVPRSSIPHSTAAFSIPHTATASEATSQVPASPVLVQSWTSGEWQGAADPKHSVLSHPSYFPPLCSTASKRSAGLGFAVCAAPKAAYAAPRPRPGVCKCWYMGKKSSSVLTVTAPPC